MKKIVLIKPIHDIQAGHIYEHIFCMQLAEYLRSKSLYSYIDYHIDAKTFYIGYIKIEVSLYTKAALKHQKAVRMLRIVADNDVIDGAALQIIAEKRMDMDVKDQNKLLQEILSYNTKPWSTLGQLDDIIPSRNNNKNLIRLYPRSPRLFLILKQSIIFEDKSLDTNMKEVVYPLFAVIGQVLTNNLQQIIADSSYCYSYEDDIAITGGAIKHINLYRIDKRQADSLSSERLYIENLLNELAQSDFISKLELLFKSTNYSLPGLAPDDDYITETTGVLVGAKGWKKRGTKENIIRILSHTRIDLKLGSSTDTIKLDRFFK